jgi:hypothetical protein
VRLKFSWPLFFITLPILFLPASILAVSPLSRASVPLLAAVTPEVINIGEVLAGGHKGANFFVTNPYTIPLSVARIKASCNCLKIELPTDVLVPGENVQGHAFIDLRAEPAFTGSLSMKAEGLDESGAVVLPIVVNVQVRRD